VLRFRSPASRKSGFRGAAGRGFAQGPALVFAAEEVAALRFADDRAGDIDLLDYAALMTLREGGSVTLVERSALPPPSLSAAILRC
jgi:hypothetical protein